jgi:hypothetical protein
VSTKVDVFKSLYLNGQSEGYLGHIQLLEVLVRNKESVHRLVGMSCSF